MPSPSFILLSFPQATRPQPRGILWPPLHVERGPKLRGEGRGESPGPELSWGGPRGSSRNLSQRAAIHPGGGGRFKSGWASASLLEKQHREEKTPPSRAQHQERKLTSNFSCFLEPGQDSPVLSILFSSPLASPSVFSGGRATAGRGEGESVRRWVPSLPSPGAGLRGHQLPVALSRGCPHHGVGPILPCRFAGVQLLCPLAPLMPRAAPGETLFPGCLSARCSGHPSGPLRPLFSAAQVSILRPPRAVLGQRASE